MSESVKRASERSERGPGASGSLGRWVEDGGEEVWRLRRGSELGAGDEVWEVGGYLGVWSGAVLGRYVCRVEVYEPVRGFYEHLRRKYAGLERVGVHGYGLAGEAGEVEMRVEGDASSRYGDGGARVEVVRMERASEEMRARCAGEVAVLSVNIEGGEYEVLEDLIASGEIVRVRELDVQFHDVVPGARERREGICADLERSHVRRYSYPWVWEGWQRRDVR